jgi:HAD superfamily hydrolase (TIGR01549 family)
VRIEAVIFDLDDTLSRHVARPDWDVVTALQAAALAPYCARLGFGPLDLEAAVRRFWPAYALRFPDPDRFPHAPPEERGWSDGPLLLRDVLAECGTVCAVADATVLWEALNNIPWRARHLHLYPDAVETVQALNAAGYRLAVATARALSAAVVALELREQGMPDLFDVIVTSGEVGYRKPHPLLFETAARALNVEPERVVVIGDSYEADVVPAAGLGMVPVLKLNERAPDPRWVLAHAQVSSLGDLLNLEIFSRSSPPRPLAGEGVGG